MGNPIYISYATKDTPYVDEMKTHLLPTLKHFGLEYDIEYPEDKGTWLQNTGYKMEFILKMLKKHKRPIIFLDADAEIWQYPELFDNIPLVFDIAVHYLSWGWVWHKNREHKRRDLLSGTMYINYNEKTVKFVEDCIKEVKSNPHQWEQKSIQKVLEHHHDIITYSLPFSYITFPNYKGEIPTHVIKEEEVVIFHTQASRKLKNRSNWK